MSFELRELKATDIMPMVKILSKIGLKNIKESFSEENLKAMISSINGETNEEKATYLGFSLIVDIVDIILENLPSCENEIYSFLAGLSGKTVDEIKDLGLGEFTTMIIEVIQKEEFKDFFKAVSKSFNKTEVV